ncbi:hypothetical protein APSETT445_004205 [Aspergillus pseudonomiae]
MSGTRHADTVINGLSKEVALTCNVMRQLGASLKEDKDAHLYSAEACSTAETVLDECQKVFDEINEIIDVSTRSSFRRIAFVLAEARRDSNLTVLRSNLEKMKSTMLLMLNVIIYAGQLRRAVQQCNEIQRYYHVVKAILHDIDAAQHCLHKYRYRRIRNGIVNVHIAEKLVLSRRYGDKVFQYFQDPFFDLISNDTPGIGTPSGAPSYSTTTDGDRIDGQVRQYTPDIPTTALPAQSYIPIMPPPPPPGTGYRPSNVATSQMQPKNWLKGIPPPPPLPPLSEQLALAERLRPPGPQTRSATWVPQGATFGGSYGIPEFNSHTALTNESRGCAPTGERQRPANHQPQGYYPTRVASSNDNNDQYPPILSPATRHDAQQGTQVGQEPSSTADLIYKRPRYNSSEPAIDRQDYESDKQDNVRLSPQETHVHHPSGDNPSSDSSQSQFFRFWRKKKEADPTYPPPEEQFLESPTSPVNRWPNRPPHLYAGEEFSDVDLSLCDGPRDAFVSNGKQLSPRSESMDKGKKWALFTLNELDYRTVDITDIDSAQTLRASICQSVGIRNPNTVEIFLTEPGQSEHNEQLSDASLAFFKTKKANTGGSLKLLVRDSSMDRNTRCAPSNSVGHGISLPEALSASSRTAVQHYFMGTKPGEANDWHANSPATPSSSQIATSRQGRNVSQDPAKASSVGTVCDQSDQDELASDDLLYRAQEHQHNFERKQRNYRRKGPTPLLSDIDSRRSGVIDFDSRISPDGDNIESYVNPLPRRAPPTRSASSTLRKVNSLKEKYRRSAGQPGSGSNMASAAGESSTSDDDKTGAVWKGPDFDFAGKCLAFYCVVAPQEDSEDDSDDGLFAIPSTDSQTPTTDGESDSDVQTREGTPRKPSLTVDTESGLKEELIDRLTLESSDLPTPLTQDPPCEVDPEREFLDAELDTEYKERFRDGRKFLNETPHNLQKCLLRWTTLTVDELAIA